MESEIIRISRATDFTRASSQIIPQRSRASLIIIHLEILETKTFSKKKKEKDTPLLRIRMWITKIENKSNRFSIFPSENSPARILFRARPGFEQKSRPTYPEFSSHLPRQRVDARLRNAKRGGLRRTTRKKQARDTRSRRETQRHDRILFALARPADTLRRLAPGSVARSGESDDDRPRRVQRLVTALRAR